MAPAIGKIGDNRSSGISNGRHIGQQVSNEADEMVS